MFRPILHSLNFVHPYPLEEDHTSEESHLILMKTTLLQVDVKGKLPKLLQALLCGFDMALETGASIGSPKGTTDGRHWSDPLGLNAWPNLVNPATHQLGRAGIDPRRNMKGSAGGRLRRPDEAVDQTDLDVSVQAP